MSPAAGRLPVAVWSGEICGVRVHVLDDGQRIIDADDLGTLHERFDDPDFDAVGFARQYRDFANGGDR